MPSTRIVVAIGDRSSRAEKDGTVIASLENKMVWTPRQSRKLIIAVGAPHEWHSSAPLPPEAVSTDLTAASITDPDLPFCSGVRFSYFCITPHDPRNGSIFHFYSRVGLSASPHASTLPTKQSA